MVLMSILDVIQEISDKKTPAPAVGGGALNLCLKQVGSPYVSD
jgi:hypothetical protein